MKTTKSLGIGILISIYLVLKPIYIGSSGSLQISDVFLLLTTLIITIRSKGLFHFDKFSLVTLKIFASLCLYQLMINVLWSINLNDNLIYSSLFYIFNFIAFFNFLVTGRIIGLVNMKDSIMYGSFFSLVIVFFGVLFTASTGRAVGFFNNPNQLGYYALIMFTIVLLCGDNFSKRIRFLMIALSFVINVASLSKASFIAMGVTLLLYVVFVNYKGNIKNIIVRVLSLLLIFMMTYAIFISSHNAIVTNLRIVSLRNRILRMTEEKDSELGSGRGYDRILELDMNFLWGMGEGAYYRFNTMTNMEAHSTYASLIVSYGLIGFTGYLLLFKNCVYEKRNTMKNLIIISGILMYQITHNGIRNTLMWLLLAVYVLQKSLIIKTETISMPSEKTINS